ncbi:MAG TPA: hypothetical protein VNL77_01115, partial [Roseiflexaceae bacterium]|nr:hypothetical protein [Roseiflexaceae bacterium]
WARRALVPLAVLLAIVALVLPRPRAATDVPAAPASPALPAELVERALDRLYQPPEGRGVWHGRYAVRWIFADASYADMDASLWMDPDGGRHRVQLVHKQGGGPFEFQLGDGMGAVWYTADPRYAASLYPQIADRVPLKVELELPAAEHERMLRARLGSGAWDLPAAYLRQAARTPELVSWGRRTADDGAALAVISFRGVSPLGPPPGAAGVTGGEVTVLLAIDTASGALYEVRELLGSDAGEQTGRTVWRFLGGEWLTPSPASDTLFEVRRVLGATSAFARLGGGPAAPELPTVPLEALAPLAGAAEPQVPQPLAPPAAPPGTTTAALLRGDDAPSATVLYIGAGRRLAIRTTTPGETARASGLFPRTAQTEEVRLGDALALLRPGPAQRYEAFFGDVVDERGFVYRARVSAQGFSRDELLEVLRGLAPLSPEAVRQQLPLFVGPRPDDPAAVGALLTALAAAPLPPPTSVRRTIARVFTRQFPGPDPLADPYHLPPYGGRPETLVVETWTRVTSGGRAEIATVARGPDGTVFDRAYSGPGGGWTYDVPRGEVMLYSHALERQPYDRATYTVARLLACGGTLVEYAGERAVIRSEAHWREFSCLLPHYRGVAEFQSQNAVLRDDASSMNLFDRAGRRADLSPFLADAPGEALTVVVVLGQAGAVTRVEVYAGAGGGTPPGVALERWERVSDEVLPAERAPADLFRSTPVGGLLRIQLDDGEAAPTVLFSITPTQARGVLGGAPYGFRPEPLEAGERQIRVRLSEIFLSPFDPDGAYHFVEDFDNPFEAALHHGAALRFEFELEDGGAGRGAWLPLYQGRAERFGAYLRARARWMASEPVPVRADGRELQGWLVTLSDGRRWAIAEADGTLLAMPADTEEQLGLLQRLKRL